MAERDWVTELSTKGPKYIMVFFDGTGKDGQDPRARGRSL